MRVGLKSEMMWLHERVEESEVCVVEVEARDEEWVVVVVETELLRDMVSLSLS